MVIKLLLLVPAAPTVGDPVVPLIGVPAQRLTFSAPPPVLIAPVLENVISSFAISESVAVPLVKLEAITAASTAMVPAPLDPPGPVITLTLAPFVSAFPNDDALSVVLPALLRKLIPFWAIVPPA